MSEYIKNLRTPIAIVGMGKSGEAAKSLLLTCGVPSEDIKTFDSKLPSADYSNDTLLMQQEIQTLVVSPGVPLATPWIENAKKQGVLITSELSLACSCLTSEKLIGITGSVGKSTTVSLLGAGLQAFSHDGFVGGNLGTPLASYVQDLLNKKRKKADWIILELSSYQLENCAHLQLDFSGITFFTSNHLERYESLQDYYKTKWKILDLTKNSVFLNSAGGDLVEYARSFSDKKLKVSSPSDKVLNDLHLKDALLIGSHNQDNLALASHIALAAQWPTSAFEGMKKFTGLIHRLENMGDIKGIRFINDSKATAMDSVLIATEAAHSTKNPQGTLYLLLGGRNKSLPWGDLSVFKKLDHTSFIFFGECRNIAQEKSGLPGPSFDHLNEALDYIFSQVKEKDTVLLSPGGTSLDEFKSFEDRGDYFKKRVEEFKKL